MTHPRKRRVRVFGTHEDTAAERKRVESAWVKSLGIEPAPVARPPSQQAQENKACPKPT